MKKKIKVSNLSQYIDKIYQKADGFAYIINGKICGLIVGYISNRYTDDVYIALFGVDSKYRKNGIGKKIMQEFLSHVPEECSIETNVDSENKVALSAYTSYGFEIIGEQDGRLTIKTNKTNCNI